MTCTILKLGPESEVLVLEEYFKHEGYFEKFWVLIPDYHVNFTIMGKLIPAPRKIASYGQDYPFSGIIMRAEPWNRDVLRVMIDACKAFHSLGDKVKISRPGFNMALLNWYRDGNDSIGDHRDDEKVVVPGSGICGVSFGSTRKFCFKPYLPGLGVREMKKKCAELNPSERLYFVDYLTRDGDLFLFQGKTNETHTHGIPKEKDPDVRPRISLTFRLFNTGPVFNSWIECANYWEKFLQDI